jgi:hypothetical protein
VRSRMAFVAQRGGMTTGRPESSFAPEREPSMDAPRETHRPRAATRQRRHGASVDQTLDDSFPASDPPSWTSAITRVAASPAIQCMNEGAVRRIRAEFLEMPGLCLTIEQAQRLWALEPRTCAALLNSLIDSRFLRRTDRGLFVLSRGGG